MKSGRLFEILLLLVRKRKITAIELADRFNVSIRTIYRDIDDLTVAGIPIYTTNGRNGGIHLMAGYILDKAIISSREKDEIFFALKTLASVPNLDNSEVLRKIAAVFEQDLNSQDLSWLDIDFSPWKSLSNRDIDLFHMIRKAIEEKKSINIQYVSTKLEEIYRIIDPIKLLFKHKDWYLIGFCKSKDDYRMFKISRIIDLQVLEENANTYISIPEMYINDYVDEKAIMDIEVIFSMKVAYKVYEEFDRNMISRYSDDKLLLNGKIEVNDWFLSKILSFGSEVYIKSPDNLKQVIIGEYNKALLKLNSELL